MSDPRREEIDTDYPQRIDPHPEDGQTDLPSDSESDDPDSDPEIDRDGVLEDTFPASDPIPPKSIT